MAETTNTTNPPGWRALNRAAELDYDKSVFGSYRNFIEASVAAEKLKLGGEEWNRAIDSMHDACRRFVSMPAYSAASIALKLAAALDAEDYGEDVFVNQATHHAPYAVVGAFIDLATMALKEKALAPEEAVQS